MIKLQSMATLY